MTTVRESAWEPGLVFLGFTALGVAAMAPSVTFGDAGEFTACAATLSVAHAPGYPLLAVLGKALGTLLPWGSWAYRSNLLSVLCAAGALALLAAAGRRAGASAAGRLGAVLLLGLCPLWRYESGVTEAFALHLLALASLLWALCRFSDRLCTARPMAFMGLAFGLGAANHHTILLAAPALVWEAWVSWRQGPHRRGSELAQAAAWFLAFCCLGLGLYLLLPLRARANPPLDWGHPVDLQRFLHVFLRRDYGSFSLTVEGAAPFSPAAVWAQSWRYLRASLGGLGWGGLGLAALGLFARGAAAPSRIGLSGWVFFTGPFFLFLGNPPFDSQVSGALERFYLASWLGLAFLASAGIDLVGSRLKAAAWLLAFLPVLSGWLSHDAWWLRRDLAAYDYGRSVLKSLPPGAVFFMDGGDDTFYTTAFLTFAEGRRPDLSLHDRGGLVFKSAYGPDFRKLSRDEKEARRQTVEGTLAAGGEVFYSTLNEGILKGAALQDWGLVRRALPSGRSAEPAQLWQLYPFRWQESLLAAHYRDRALVCFYPVMRASALMFAGRLPEALRELQRAWLWGADVLWLAPHLSYAAHRIGYQATIKSLWPLAEEALLLAITAAPPQADQRTSLGAVYERTGRWAEAERSYREAVRLEPKSGKAYYNLGAFLWGRSRWSEAAAAFDEAARLDPSDDKAAWYAIRARQQAVQRR